MQLYLPRSFLWFQMGHPHPRVTICNLFKKTMQIIVQELKKHSTTHIWAQLPLASLWCNITYWHTRIGRAEQCKLVQKHLQACKHLLASKPCIQTSLFHKHYIWDNVCLKGFSRKTILILAGEYYSCHINAYTRVQRYILSMHGSTENQEKQWPLSYLWKALNRSPGLEWEPANLLDHGRSTCWCISSAL